MKFNKFLTRGVPIFVVLAICLMNINFAAARDIIPEPEGEITIVSQPSSPIVKKILSPGNTEIDFRWKATTTNCYATTYQILLNGVPIESGWWSSNSFIYFTLKDSMGEGEIKIVLSARMHLSPTIVQASAKSLVDFARKTHIVLISASAETIDGDDTDSYYRRLSVLRSNLLDMESRYDLDFDITFLSYKYNTNNDVDEMIDGGWGNSWYDEIEDAFNSVKASATVNDDVMIFWNGHGSTTEFAVGSSKIEHEDFADIISDIMCYSMIISIHSCHSGAVIDNIDGYANRIILTSSTQSENSSWGELIDAWAQGVKYESFQYFSGYKADVRDNREFNGNRDGTLSLYEIWTGIEVIVGYSTPQIWIGGKFASSTKYIPVFSKFLDIW